MAVFAVFGSCVVVVPVVRVVVFLGVALGVVALVVVVPVVVLAVRVVALVMVVVAAAGGNENKKRKVAVPTRIFNIGYLARGHPHVT